MTVTSRRATILIDAPASAVFRFISDPVAVFALSPAPVEALDAHMTPQGVGSTYQWSGQMLGLSLRTEVTRTEQVADTLIVDVSKGPAWTWTLEPHGDQTLLRVEWDLSSVVPLLDKVFVATAGRHAEEGLLRWLTQIKREIEGT